MFANRFTAFVDACALAGVLKRNLLLTLAEAEFFRVRWSQPVLDETQEAIRRILVEKGDAGAVAKSIAARTAMEEAFEEALVTDFEAFMCVGENLPDPKDAHVLAAALKTQAQTIVTDNLKDFPVDILSKLNMEVRPTDGFIADTISLDPGRAVAAIRNMRLRFKNPAKTPDVLLLDMEASGLVETVDSLKSYRASL